MDHDLVRRRLSEVRIPFRVPAFAGPTVPLAEKLPWWLFCPPRALQPDATDTNIAAEVLQELGYEYVPSEGLHIVALHAMAPIEASTDMIDVLLRRGPSDSPYWMSAGWRLAARTERGSERVREALRRHLASSDSGVCDAALLGLLVHGAEADAQAVLPLLGNDSVATAVLALSVLHRLKALGPLAESGALDVALSKRSDQVVQGALDVLLGGNPHQLTGLFSDTDWSLRCALYVVMGLLARQGVDPHALYDVLEAQAVNESDNDAWQYWCLALAALLPALGVEIVEPVLALALARDRGSHGECAIIRAVGMADWKPQEAEAAEAALRGAAFDNDQTWTRRAMAAARAGLSQRRGGGGLDHAETWAVLMETGEGLWTQVVRYDEAPPATLQALLDLDASVPDTSLAAVVQMPSSSYRLSAFVGALLARRPQLSSFCEDLALLTSTGDASRMAAAALLLHPGPLAIPPVLFRCLVGMGAGGAMPDDLETLGSIMALLGTDLDADARRMLELGGTSAQALARGFFGMQYVRSMASGGDSALQQTLVTFGGGGMSTRRERSARWPILRWCARHDVDSSRLSSSLLGVDPKEALGLLRACLRDATSVPYSIYEALGGAEALWRRAPVEDVQPLWIELARCNDSTIKRFIARVAKATGEGLLAGAAGEAVREKLVSLASDGDSDVSSAASAACVDLGLETEAVAAAETP